MNTHKQISKEREELELKIRALKLKVERLPVNSWTRPGLLAELASLRIRYALLQEETLKKFRAEL